jgi:hypothetical protein
MHRELAQQICNFQRHQNEAEGDKVMLGKGVVTPSSLSLA